MKNNILKCIKMFAAVQYFENLDTIISAMQKNENLKEYLCFPANGNESVHNFQKFTKGLVNEEGKLEIDTLPDGSLSNNNCKIGLNRIELFNSIKEKNDELNFVNVFLNIFNLHKDLYKNQATKFGLVKTYLIEGYEKIVDINLPLKKLFKDKIKNSKHHILINREDFNINFQIYSIEDKNYIDVDVNDIIELNKEFDWNHMNEIVIMHDKIVENEIPTILGGTSL